MRQTRFPIKRIAEAGRREDQLGGRCGDKVDLRGYPMGTPQSQERLILANAVKRTKTNEFGTFVEDKH